ncbi:MAG: AAA family ATPase [Legionella sp.]|nr:AAA family ATPase [Legionella sp.]
MIYYWSGASGSELLLENHAETIQALLTGDYNPHDLEKLRGQSSPIIYSYRLTQKARLLFTTHKGSLHVLEHLPNHEYKTARFLKTGVLKDYLEHVDESTLFIPIENSNEQPSFCPEPVGPVQSIRLDYYNRQFIHFTETQDAIVHQRQLPLILNGAAGSGKTYVGLGMIKAWLQAQSHDASFRCLYVTEERSLVDVMRHNWNNYFSPDAPDAVEFKTYADVFSDLHQDEKATVTQAFFEAWWLNLKKNDAIFLQTADAYYQEFRICSGLSREAYAHLGERQSSIPRGSARDALYTSYLRYLNYLQPRHVDLALSPWRADFPDEARYDFIMVDEGQRFSLLQNKLLTALVKNNAILYCMDAHQNLVDQYSSRVLLELELRDIGIQTCTLDKTYRCKPKIAEVLTQILENNRCILGGKVDKYEASAITTMNDTEGGQFYRLSPKDVSGADWLLSRAEGVHLAVVTHQAYVDEARRVFNTPLVFTPEEIQGQEFHTVVVYKLLADEVSQRRIKQVSSQLSDKASSSNQHRSKNKSGHQDAPWVHRIFTACSRAQDTLVVVDAPNAYWGTMPGDKVEKIVPIESFPTTSQEDREAMARTQALHGNHAIAERLRAQMQVQREVRTPNYEALSLKKKSLSKKSPPKQIAIAPSRVVFDRSRGDELLKCIIHKKSFNLIKSLINNPRVDLNQKYSTGFTPLMLAISYHDIALVTELLKMGDRVDLNAVHAQGTTALHLAASIGNLDIFRELLSMGDRIDLNVSDNDGFTVAMIVAQKGHLDMLNMLLHMGDRVDLNYVDHQGFTAIACAAQEGRVDCVRALLNAGRPLNLEYVAVDHTTVLTSAIINNHREIVRMLLDETHEPHMQFDPNGIFFDRVVFDQVVNTFSTHKDMLSMLLDHRHVLTHFVRNEFLGVSELLNNSPGLMSLCIQRRSEVWDVLKSLKKNASISDAAQRFFCLLFANTPETKYYGLNQVLLKRVPEKSIFFAHLNKKADEIQKALKEEITDMVLAKTIEKKEGFNKSV